MTSVNTGISNLKEIGTDMDKAIYNGFKSFIPDLNLSYFCVYTTWKKGISIKSAV